MFHFKYDGDKANMMTQFYNLIKYFAFEFFVYIRAYVEAKEHYVCALSFIVKFDAVISHNLTLFHALVYVHILFVHDYKR